MKLQKFDTLDKNLEYWQKLYLEDKKAKNYSKHTLIGYKQVLKIFREFCEEDEELSFEDMNRYFFNSFISFLKYKNLSDKSIEFYINVIKNFFNFISEESEIDVIKYLKKVNIKVKQKEAKHYTKDEIYKIETYLKDLILNSKVYSKVRNAVAILFLIYTGIRAGELLNIKKENIILDIDHFKIKILGKGNKERIIYIKKELIEKEYQKLLNLGFGKFDIKYISLFQYNERLCKKLNIQNKGLHSYRHSLAIKAVENDVNLETIKEWLGHSTIMITSKYYAKANEKAKKGMAGKLNP